MYRKRYTAELLLRKRLLKEQRTANEQLRYAYHMKKQMTTTGRRREGRAAQFDRRGPRRVHEGTASACCRMQKAPTGRGPIRIVSFYAAARRLVTAAGFAILQQRCKCKVLQLRCKIIFLCR